MEPSSYFLDRTVTLQLERDALIDLLADQVLAAATYHRLAQQFLYELVLERVRGQATETQLRQALGVECEA